jgi:adenylate cyclase
MERLRELNAAWPEAIRINIGIGLNSGIMTVGNMGSPTRMNYTLMGDNVNLGARLEGTNKEYGTNVIISEFTYGLVKDKFLVRELDNIRVKGKNKPVLIYELVDCLEDIAPPPLSESEARHAKK